MRTDRQRLELVPDGDQHAEIDRLVSLGARRVGEDADGTATLTDPDGNAFILRPSSN